MRLIDDLEIFVRRANRTVQCEHTFTLKKLPYVCEFNSWGFRDQEFDAFAGKSVNICLGDSFVVNQGDVVENAWPQQLNQRTQLPTLNLGLDGAGNDTIKLIYDRACKIFNVENVFVMYSFFHRRLEDNILTQCDVEDFDFDSNIAHFKKNFIPDAHYTFNPEWCWNDEEADFIRKYYHKHLPKCYTHWHATGHAKKKPRIEQLDSDLFNADGMHMSKERNSKIADYFEQFIL